MKKQITKSEHQSQNAHDHYRINRIDDSLFCAGCDNLIPKGKLYLEMDGSRDAYCIWCVDDE